jgi:hypothetical protein
MAKETGGDVTAGSRNRAGFDVSEKLRLHLSVFMGKTGYQALVGRALALSSAEVPALRAVRVRADGSLHAGDDLEAQPDSAEFLEGREVLLAHLLDLLIAFIGASLTVRLVRETWPKIPLDDLDFANGGKK